MELKANKQNLMPVNSKSMFAALCKTMEKLESGEINVNQVNAMAKLIGQANNLLNYELKRAVIMGNQNYAEHHRNIELKTFDSLPEPE